MNALSFSGILLGATCSILLLILAIYGKTRLHRAWLLVNLAIAVWGIGSYYIGKAADLSSAARVWQCVLAGVILIPVIAYHSWCIFCNVESARKKLITFAYAQALFFLSLDINGRFVTRMRITYDSVYYIQSAGLLHVVFFSLWMSFVILGYYELAQYYRKSSGLRKYQALYLLIGGLIGFSGAVIDFLPMFFRVNIFPAGNYIISTYSLITTYGILRHRFLDFHVIVKKSLIYSLSMSLITGLFLLLVFIMTKYLTELIAIPSFAITVICTLLIAFLFTPLKNGVQSFVDKTFYKTTYDYYTTVKKISHDLASSIGLRPTYKLIVDTIVDTLKLRKAYLLSVMDDLFQPTYARFHSQETSHVVSVGDLPVNEESREHSTKYRDEKQPPTDSLLVTIAKKGEILIREELSHLKEQDAAIAIAAELRPFAGEVVVPIFVEDKLTYLMILGEKLSADAFTVEDINLLSTISSQASIALRNAKLYDELEARVKERTAQLTLANTLLQEQIAEKKKVEEALKSSNEEIKSFAFIVSHDMRAPLVNIKGFSSEMKVRLKKFTSLTDKLLSLVSEKEQEELKTIVDKEIPKALVFIESSVNRMDAQIGAILKLSRVGRKQLHPEQINTENLFQSILRTLTHQIEAGKVSVTIGTLPEVVVDRSSMEQIIGNLLDNA
ncbi:MAG TPA: hypothetical protein DCP92_14135, partial [Nitrospiraceae bacterium]|nr:hypothetical protein [Nitrospiraceae bacterium]